MITAIVQFKVGKDVSRDEVLTSIQNAAPRFQNVDQLIRKNFLFDEQRGVRGGVYTWKSREAAEAFHAKGGAWRQAIIDLSGAEPEITWFETPVLVDNTTGEIQLAD